MPPRPPGDGGDVGARTAPTGAAPPPPTTAGCWTVLVLAAAVLGLFCWPLGVASGTFAAMTLVNVDRSAMVSRALLVGAITLGLWSLIMVSLTCVQAGGWPQIL
jgi:hypothetical protein